MNSSLNVGVRKPRIADIDGIFALVEAYAKRGDMLHRPISEIYTHLRSFFIYEDEEGLAGACSLNISMEGLSEVRSLAVREGAEGRGVGTALVTACLDEARALGLKRVFALTYHPKFFLKLGFRMIDKAELPQKIWGECIKCAKFPNCDENAVIIEL